MNDWIADAPETMAGKPTGVRKRLTILGATGSIGDSTLDLVSRDPDAFDIVALTAATRVDELADRAIRVGAECAVIADERHFARLKERLSGTGIIALSGGSGLMEAASLDSDIVLAAIMGFAGLRPTLAAVDRGATIALANKECLVAAGSLFMARAASSAATVLPVDSEHNAIFQALAGSHLDSVAEIVLTASGGPFRQFSYEDMKAVTPAQALKHPNWSMGAKITIDSATLMNKGLELIEAAHLFPVPAERLDAIVHPQSIVHGFVRFNDGSVIAQMGPPDMRGPISFCLNWPQRAATPCDRLDLAALGSLTFEPVDAERFPAFALARTAMATGRGLPVVLNAANEIAVAAFLSERIGFTDIAVIVEQVMTEAERTGRSGHPADLEDVFALDGWSRKFGEGLVSNP